FVKYLAASPRLDRVRTRAVGVTAGLAGFLMVLLGVVPFPCSFRAPGVVMASQRIVLANQTAGIVETLAAQPGSFVKRGQPLLQLKNPELEFQLASARAHLDEVNARLLQAMKNDSANIAPLTRLRDYAGDQVAKLTADTEHLTVRAPHDGVWVSPLIEDRRGSWLERGSNLGLLVNPASFKFVATVMEEDVNALFASDIHGANARLYGESGTALPVTNWRVVPGGQQILPSAALGWSAGGQVPVAMENNTQGNKTVEPFFEVRGDLEA